jgi:hypothetical protein
LPGSIKVAHIKPFAVELGASFGGRLFGGGVELLLESKPWKRCGRTRSNDD